MHDLEAANALLARWKLIGIMIPVLAGIWNRIRAHPLQRKIDHLDKRVDEGLKEIHQEVECLAALVKQALAERETDRSS